MFVERRKFPRVNVRYEVKIICEGTIILGKPQGYTFHTYTEDLSQGGVRVTLEQEVQVGSLVNLELYVNNEKTLPARCKGIVSWTKIIEGTSPPLFYTGIQFLDLESDVGSQIIKGIVNFHLDKNKKPEK
jgi:c-di-GMP-binding flagellar brake protein YcgR